jgi:polyisoprenoid-binding protein YceI
MSSPEAKTDRFTNAEQIPVWTFDPSHTEAAFCARRMGAIWVDGRFKDVQGKFYLDPAQPLSASCVGEIDVSKLFAGQPYLNTQLRAADFLAAKDHPTITFAARFAQRVGESESEFKADVYLTIRGTTQLLSMDVAYLGHWRAPLWLDGENLGTLTRVGFRAAGLITREDFEIVSPDTRRDGGAHRRNAIEIRLDIEAVLDADLESMPALEL